MATRLEQEISFLRKVATHSNIPESVVDTTGIYTWGPLLDSSGKRHYIRGEHLVGTYDQARNKNDIIYRVFLPTGAVVVPVGGLGKVSFEGCDQGWAWVRHEP